MSDGFDKGEDRREDGALEQSTSETGFIMYDREETPDSEEQKPEQQKPEQAWHNTDISQQPDNQGNTEHVPQNMNNSRSYSSYHITEPAAPKKKERKNIWKKAAGIAAAGLLFGLVAGGTIAAVNYFFGGNTTQQSVSQNGGSTAQNDNGGTEVQTSRTSKKTSTVVTDVTSVVEMAMPSVVSITNQSVQEVQSFFGREKTQYESQSSGSGIIVGQNETELLIATNYHVVKDATTLTVCFINNAVIEAKIKGTDAANDLAVIAVKLEDIEAETIGQISIATLGDSDGLKAGEPAIAIGNALGYGQSVTVGVVSALNVIIDEEGSDYIQTDAAINPGNSGGALLNVNGEVIGINAAKISASSSSVTVEGMGYAIPISVATPILDELMIQVTKEQVPADEQGFLGIQAGVDVTSDVSEAYGIPVGVRVSEAIEGYAAEAAGIRKGDVIVALDKVKIETMEKLQESLKYYRAGEEVTVTIMRQGEDGEYEEHEISVILSKKR